MNNKRKILIVLLVITLMFIWGNSLFDKEASAQESRLVVRILEIVFGQGNVSEHFVRKLAHFAEYTVLGMELYALSGRFMLGAAHGMFAAVIDETIQLMVNRGSNLADVWLDFSGVVFGSVILVLLGKLVERKRKIENSKNK